LWQELVVAEKRRRRELLRVWQTAALIGNALVGKPTPLEQFLGLPARRQRPQEQLAVMQQIAALTGRALQFRPANREPCPIP
jgi:hypothetical protein